MLTYKHIVTNSLVRLIGKKEFRILITFIRSKLFCMCNQLFIQLRILLFLIMLSKFFPKPFDRKLFTKFIKKGDCADQKHLNKRNRKILIHIFYWRVYSMNNFIPDDFKKLFIFLFFHQSLANHILYVGIISCIRTEAEDFPCLSICLFAEQKFGIFFINFHRISDFLDYSFINSSSFFRFVAQLQALCPLKADIDSRTIYLKNPPIAVSCLLI